MGLEKAIERLSQERAVADRIDTTRQLEAGGLSPRQRISAICDPGTFLEIGGLARSQQPSVHEETPADGLITGFGKVQGREVSIICEDPIVLGRTDAQVAGTKRQRIVGLSAAKNLPILILADGPAGMMNQFAPGQGRLFGYLSRGFQAPSIGQLEAPSVCILFGPCVGETATLALGADLLIAVDGLAAPARDGQGLGVAGSDLVDLIASHDLEALEFAMRFLSLTPSELGTPLMSSSPSSDSKPSRLLSDDDLGSGPSPHWVIEGLVDGGSFIEFGFGVPVSLVTGLGTIAGYPVAIAATGGPVALETSSVLRIARVASMSRRFEIPFLTVQDCTGYDPKDSGTSEFLRALQELLGELTSSSAPKLSLITGKGQAMSNFVLGARELGFDYIAAWPWAHVPATDGPASQVSQASVPSAGPWLAAGLGVIDEVLAPSESRARIGQMISILAASRVLPKPEASRRGRLIDDIPTV